MAEEKTINTDEVLAAWRSAQWRKSSPIDWESDAEFIAKTAAGEVKQIGKAITAIEIGDKLNERALVQKAKESIAKFEMTTLKEANDNDTMVLVYSIKMYAETSKDGALSHEIDIELVGPGYTTHDAVAWRIATDRAAGQGGLGEWDPRTNVTQTQSNGSSRRPLISAYLDIMPGARPMQVELKEGIEEIGKAADDKAALLGPNKILQAPGTGAPAEAMRDAFNAWAAMEQSIKSQVDRKWFSDVMEQTRSGLERVSQTERALLEARGERLTRKLLQVAEIVIDAAGGISEAVGEAQYQARVEQLLEAHGKAIDDFGKKIESIGTELENRKTTIDTYIFDNRFVRPLSQTTRKMKEAVKPPPPKIDRPIN